MSARTTRTRQGLIALLCVHAVSLLLLDAQQVQAQGIRGTNPPGMPNKWLPENTARPAGGMSLGAGQPGDEPLPLSRRPGAAAPGMGGGMPPLQRPTTSPALGSAVANGAKRRRKVPPGATKAPGSQAAAGRSPVRAGSATANPPGSLHNILAKNTPLFRSLLTVLDISADQIPEGTVGTFFVPSDKAIETFLQDMGLTAQQLSARPELVDMIVSYHFVPGYQVQGTADVADGNRVVVTGDEQYILRLSQAAGADDTLVVSDVQRNKANVVDGPIVPTGSNGITVFVVDNVLRSANYFPTIEAALSHSPYWITSKNTAVKAGILPKLEGSAVTMFVPDNAAFKPLEANLSRASPGRLADILQYHVLTKVRRIPRGFESGPADTLLKGHQVDINVTEEMQKDPFSGNRTMVPQVSVTPEIGRAAKVTVYNIYAGRSILQGINAVLLPDLPADANEAPPADEDQPPEDEEPPGDITEEAGPRKPSTGPKRTSSARDQAEPVRRPPGATSGSRPSTVPTAGANRGQRPARTAPADDGADSNADAAPAPMQAAGRTTPPGLAGRGMGGSVSGLRPQGSATTSGTAPRRPAAMTVLAEEGQDQKGAGRHLLLQLPRSMLAAGLAPARRLLQQKLQPSLRSRARPKPATAPSGALSSTVNVGAIGELQTFAHGITSNKTLKALELAAQPKVPKQYVNRYGSFKGPTVKGGCLNCKAWGKESQ